MKEPKFPRLEDLPKDNKYNFFAEGVFPDSVEEKKDRNKSAQKRKDAKYRNFIIFKRN